MFTALPWLLALAHPIDLRAEVDRDRLEADVRALSGEQAVDGALFLSRHIAHPDHERVGDWLHGRLEAIDRLEVRVQTFDAAGRTGLRNFVADLPGTDPGADLVVIGAHWDSTGEFADGWTAETDPAPGADDDASGVAAVLELARIFAGYEFEHTVRFALFDAEEHGLLGSVALAAEMHDAGDRVRLMYSLDPIGYNHNANGFLWVTYDERWSGPGLAMAELAAEVAPALDVTALERQLIGGSTRSDHASFWDQEYPALHVASWPQPLSYHTPDDTVANVDFGFLTETAVLVGEHAASEAALVVAEPQEKAGCGCDSGGAGGWWWVAVIGLRRRSGVS